MTIDPKAAELAKALADAVAAQQTEEYQALAEAAKRKAEIDSAAEKAAYRLKNHYIPVLRGENFPASPGAKSGDWQGSVGEDNSQFDASIFDPPSSDPAHYDLPEDETATAKPNGGLSE